MLTNSTLSHACQYPLTFVNKTDHHDPEWAFNASSTPQDSPSSAMESIEVTRHCSEPNASQWAYMGDCRISPRERILYLTMVEAFAYIDPVRSLSVSHDQNMPQEGCHSIFRPDSRRVQHSLLPSNPRWLDFLQGSPTSLCDARGIKSSRRVAVLLPALRARHRDPFHAGGLFVYQAGPIFHQPCQIFYQAPRFLLPSALIFTKRSHFLLPRGPIFSPRALIFPAIK